MTISTAIMECAAIVERETGRKPTQIEISIATTITTVGMRYTDRGREDARKGQAPLSLENFRESALHLSGNDSDGKREVLLWFAEYLYECYMIGCSSVEE